MSQTPIFSLDLAKSSTVSLKIACLVLTLMTTAFLTPRAEAGIENVLPASIPNSFRQLARHIDQARTQAEGDFSNCTLYAEISTDLAYVAIGHINDGNLPAVAQFKSIGLSISRAQGACLMQDQIQAAGKYASKMLAQAEQDLLQLTQSLGY